MGFALSEMQLTSHAFQSRQPIPQKYSPEGQDVSPALAWSNAPAGTKSFAVICHDPDAPLMQNGIYGFVHWVLYNIHGSTSELAEGTQEGTAGPNDFGTTGYGGPMPPGGHGVHHYFFWVLALDNDLQLPAGLSMTELLERIEPHVIGMNRLVGTYER
jgi:Raf kinase inhibitor-like YbhB/YbcL family protein